MKKSRLDILLLEKGLASTRTKAQELIRQGSVSVNGVACRQPGEKVAEDSALELTSLEHPYVSRGGVKLQAALSGFSLSVSGLRVLDVGQSTGGFTDCLLQNGASEVVGIEVGHSQLNSALREDPRVSVFERQDIRKIPPEMLHPAFPFCVVDLSFISLRLVVPVLPKFLAATASALLLVKPQFEVGPQNIGSGGIVRDPSERQRAVEEIKAVSKESGFTVAGSMLSPVTGTDGNQEFFLYLQWRSS